MSQYFPKTFVMSNIQELGFLIYKDIENNSYYISNFPVHMHSYYQEKTFELPKDVTLIENFHEKSLNFYHPKLHDCFLAFIYGNKKLKYDTNFPYPEQFVKKIEKEIRKIEDERENTKNCIIS